MHRGTNAKKFSSELSLVKKLKFPKESYNVFEVFFIKNVINLESISYGFPKISLLHESLTDLVRYLNIGINKS